MPHRIEVASIEVLMPSVSTEPKVFYASRLYYPQHPSNAVEFDDATTGLRTMVFGPAIVRHLEADPGPKSPLFTSSAYYGFWLFWLAVLIGGVWWATR